MKKVIFLDVGPNGETFVEADGFAGKGCKDATKFLEEALGTAADTKKKKEFFSLAQTSACCKRTYKVQNL